jgi:hypothetical protein
MERQLVQSSNVYSVGYDAEKRRLEVEFVNGGVYEYLDVPPEKHEALLAAESKGRYLTQQIKPLHTVNKIPGEVGMPQVDHR